MHASNPDHPPSPEVASPFSDASHKPVARRRKVPPITWLVVSILGIIALGLGIFFLLRYVNDPLRTLEPFPVGKYIDGYKAVVGSKFRGDLRVENDLGWKEGVGRLMVFTAAEDPRPIVVMMPPTLAKIYFTKGQTYEAELEVKEGGLIYANSCRKN